MPFIVIGLILLLYSFINYHKAFLLFLIFKIFLVTNIVVLSKPGIPLFTLDDFLTLTFLLLYFKQTNKKYRYDNTPFPLKVPFVFLCISWMLSSIFAISGFNMAITQCIKNILEQVIIVWLIWKMIKDKKDFIFLLKGFTFAFLITCIYGLYEEMIQTNPLADFEASMVGDQTRAINFDYTNDLNRGYRIKSVFEHAIGAGINWGMYIILICTFIFRTDYKLKKLYLPVILTSVLALCCMIFTKSRGPYLFLMIGFLCFINPKKLKFWITAILLIIIFVEIAPNIIGENNILLSLFNSQAQVGGSNQEMRLDQLGASIALMSKSPIVGLGFKFNTVLNNTLTSRLLGEESIWFNVITQFGLLGFFAELILGYYTLIKIPIKYKSQSLFFLSCAYWVVYSLTSVPGMLIYMYYMIMIFFIKSSCLEKKSELLIKTHNIKLKQV